MASLSSFDQSIAIPRCDRWLVYQRLWELEIACACPLEGGLQVNVPSPAIAIQVWSVVLQTIAPRGRLVAWLEQCWEMN